MASFQYRELLAKNEVFEKQTVTTVENSEDRTRQEYKRVYHVRVLSRIPSEWQCRILLKSQADGILARDSGVRARKLGGDLPEFRCGPRELDRNFGSQGSRRPHACDSA